MITQFTDPSELLSKGYGGVIKRCWDCLSWVGRCKKGHIWKIAKDEACHNFEPRKKKGTTNNAEN
ncbi:MAG: hypothetical protein FWD52_08040 [Candidatus Bathyarchaeota archaeon]|nr:hypothetical protein [Candidatus Termiticorpusculum sp.]